MSRWTLERRADAQSDQRLADRARRGDEAAFAAIVARYHAPLLAVARRLRSDGRAEDIVQQTFLNALIALRSGSEVRHLRGWLHQILRHEASRSPSPSEVALDPERELGGTMVDDDVERRLAVRQVLTAMVALPDRQREAMVGTALEGRSRSAVAEAMGLSDGAVRQLVHRARRTLREAAYALTPWPLQRWLTRPGSGPSGGSGSDAAVALSAPVPAAAVKLAAVVASGALAVGVLGPGAHGHARAHPSARGAKAARVVQSAPGGTILAAGAHARLAGELFAISRLGTRGEAGTGRGSRHESDRGHDGGGERGASGRGGPGPSSRSGSGSDGRDSGSGSSHGETSGGGSGVDGDGTSGSGHGGGSGTTTSGGSDGGSGPEAVSTTAGSGGGPGPETVTTTGSSGGGPGPSPTTTVSPDEGSRASTSGGPDGGTSTTTSSGGGSTSGH